MMNAEKKWERLELIVILGALTAFAPLSTDMYLPSLPTLERVFATDAAHVQLSLSSFFLAFALGQAVYGPLADRFGRKPPLYIGLVLYVASSIGCVLVRDINALIVLRFLQAAGACAGAVVARAMVRDLFTVKEAVGVYASLMIVNGLAPMLAPVVGGLLITVFPWTSVFWVLAGIGTLGLLAVIFRLKESHQGGQTPLRLGVVFGNYGRLLRHRYFMGNVLAGGMTMAGLFAYISGAAFVFVSHFGLSEQMFSILFGVNAFSIIFAGRLNTVLCKRFDVRKVMIAGGVIQILGGLGMLVAATTGIGGVVGFSVPLVLFVSCVGIIGPITGSLAMAPFRENAGSASALLGTLQFSAGAVSSALIGVFSNGTPVPMAIAVFVCALSGALAFWFMVPKEN